MLKPADYFNRYGEHLGTGMSPGKAFLSTEKEFFRVYGVRRFKNYNAFRRSYWLYRLGKHNKMVILHIVEDFNTKK